MSEAQARVSVLELRREDNSSTSSTEGSSSLSSLELYLLDVAYRREVTFEDALHEVTASSSSSADCLGGVTIAIGSNLMMSLETLPSLLTLSGF